MKKISKVQKVLYIGLSLLIFVTLLWLPLNFTTAKYSQLAYQDDVSIVISGNPPAGDVNSQEPPSIEEVKPNTVYQVKSGDTLSKIAEKFNITIEALAAYNNIENTDNIQVGAILRIPPKDYVPPVSSKPSEQTDNTEKTENSSAEAEPSAALTGSDSSKEVRSENETIVENSDGTSETDTALTSETKETSEEISTAVSADEEHNPLSDSNSDFQSEISRTPDNETE